MKRHFWPRLPTTDTIQGNLDGKLEIFKCNDCHAVKVVYSMGEMTTKVETVEPPQQSCTGRLVKNPIA